MHLESSWIQDVEESVDQLAFPGSVCSFKEYNYRNFLQNRLSLKPAKFLV